MDDLRTLLTDLARAADVDPAQARTLIAGALPPGDLTPILDETLPALTEIHRAMVVVILAAEGRREAERWARALLASSEVLVRIDAAVACAHLGLPEGERVLFELAEEAVLRPSFRLSAAWVLEGMESLGDAPVAERVRARIAELRARP